ncbi:MAG TPA: D-aminoacylase, partial [Thermoanaerobaculia bacterium]
MRKLLFLLGLLTACRSAAPQYDVVIRNGVIYDGSGSAPRRGDLAMTADRIAAIASAGTLHGKSEVDAHGLAIAPGFINMLSWAVDSLIVDGRSQSDIRQGVTLEVFGEGESMGPLTPEMKEYALRRQGDIKYPIEWTTLAEYLDWLTRHGVSPNVASFVGATTIRIHEIGFADRPPAPDELARMKELVRQAMRDGALGVGSSLIYAPAFYAKTPELIELCKAAGEFGGTYISHMRSEGNQLEQAVDELITIAREANVPAEIYHLKAAGEKNWPKLDSVIRRVEDARAHGIRITADMYTYTAGATGLDAVMPPWVQEGGFEKWRERLMDPAIRARVLDEMRTPTDAWENFFILVGSPDRILLTGFKNDKLKPLTGKTLAEV